MNFANNISFKNEFRKFYKIKFLIFIFIAQILFKKDEFTNNNFKFNNLKHTHKLNDKKNAMLKIVIKINEILNKINIIKHEINVHFETIVVFVDEIIKFKNFVFMKTCLKIISNFARRN